MRIPVPALIFVGLGAGWIASCSDDEPGAKCVANTTRRCADVGRCEGVETCLADGSGYGPCDCSGPPRPDGAGGSSSEEEFVIHVGRKCDVDDDCGEGLECFSETQNRFYGGGPANGYCSVACNESTECAAIDRQSDCLGGLCVRTCFSGSPGSLEENKCLGRRDVACQSLAYLGQADFTGNRQEGWCLPQCGSDDDCGGRACDLARGLCASQPAQGLGIGAACANDDECAGARCFILGAGESACTAPCVFGHPAGCGYGPTANPREAGCLTPAVAGITSSEGLGDVGLCFELCDVTSDCTQASSGWECIPRPEAEPLGRVGICSTPDPVGDAGADADATPSDADTPDTSTGSVDPPDANTGLDGG